MKTRREWKAEYREKVFPMGVLQIRNLADGKVFLDSGLNLPSLKNRHRFMLNLGTHPNRGLQVDWNCLGEKAFCFEIVNEVEREPDHPDRDYRSDVKALEQLVFEEKRPFGMGGYHYTPISGRS